MADGEKNNNRLSPTTVALAVTVLAMITVPMATMIVNNAEDTAQSEKRLKASIAELKESVTAVEARSAERRITMDVELQREIGASNALTDSEVKNLDNLLQREIASLKSLLEQRVGRNQADIMHLLRYHRDPTRAESQPR